MNLNEILSAPYPVEKSVIATWRVIVLFGLFVFLFLLVFQPFGLSESFPGKFWVILGYGGITSLALWLVNFVLLPFFPRVFTDDNWVVWKEILFTLFVIVLIAALNTLYTIAMGFAQMSFYYFVYFLSVTFSLGVIPVAFLTVLSYFHLLRKNMAQAALQGPEGLVSAVEDSTPNPQVILEDAAGEGVLELPLANFIAVDSAGNYVEVHFVEKGEQGKVLVRNTLKNTARRLKAIDCIIQVHRSHLVNLQKVKKISGNAQGLKLSLEGTDHTVAVSRSYIEDFKKKMDQIRNA